MARTVIGVADNSAAANGNSVVTAGSIAVGATGTSGYTIAGQNRDERFGFRVNNSGTATGIITLKASDLYILKDQGDLEVTVGVSVTKFVGPLEGQRFTQSGYTGQINVDSGITGTIEAYQL
jgi:hypothetical protein